MINSDQLFVLHFNIIIIVLLFYDDSFKSFAKFINYTWVYTFIVQKLRNL